MSQSNPEEPKVTKRPDPIVLVEVGRYGAYAFQDEHGEQFAECNADSNKDVKCHHCGVEIKNYASCYRDSLYNWYCTNCITTIQMGDLWAVYHMRNERVCEE